MATATEDARWRQSTQYRLWTFSPEQLASLRQQNNKLAKQTVSTRLRASNPPVDPLPEFLAPADEAALLTYYSAELLRAAAFIELPTEVRATAAILLRRFYVTNSIMTYPPTELLKTCLFFACKAEGWHMRLAKFAEKFPHTTGEEVLAAEYVLCQGIRFAFDVRHPFRALEGIVMELRRLGEFEKSRVNAAHMAAREVLKFSPLVTDAYFHYTPSQIMFAALLIADREMVERLLKDAFAGQDDVAKEKIVTVIEECRDMLAKEPPERFTKYWGTAESRDLVKPLNKKLRKCRDPDRVDLIALQKARKEQAQQKKPKPKAAPQDDLFGGNLKEERESKRRRKDGNNPDDVFGGALG